jgi:glycosyltransferase involved in cell wall biosynthesis
MSRGNAYAARLSALLRKEAYAVCRFRSAAMRALISQSLNGSPPDLIVADSLYALVNVPATPVPIALNCHNVEWLILDRYARLERNPCKRLYADFEARNMRVAEHGACLRSVACMVCSEHDAELLRQICPDRAIYVVPNCIDTDAYVQQQVEPGLNSEPVLLFQGGMDWHPNRDAVEYFLNRIFPAIREQFPGARFIVAGRNPSAEFVRKNVAGGGVEFTGTVPDMQPYLARATLGVVPLRIGSGTRLKILEAAAAGKAIVSTTLGAEGLQFEAEREIILADDPQQFAVAVVALLRNAERRKRMGQAARQRVIEQYNFATLRSAVDECISEVVRNKECNVADDRISDAKVGQ